VIRLRGLVKRYGAVEALRGLDLDVRPGQVYGFLGRNGAGKSTALRIIMGITLPTAGDVQIFGRSLRGEDPGVRRRIGYVAQEQSFYGWMTPLGLGRFVSGFYPSWQDAEYRRLLALLEIPADRRIQTFSGGTHAKLALAVALAHRPELLVLDEPTAGMDAVARREFLELVRLQAQRTGRTTLFSSHLIDEVELAADTVGIIEGGRLLWQGPAGTLQAQFRQMVLDPADPAAAGTPPFFAGAVGMPNLPGLPGLQILEDRQEGTRRTMLVRAADSTVLEALAVAAPGWQLSIPSLEDVFVALVRRPLAY
jgi:ABC-2 type transport system ATP-binding protein